MNLKDIKIGQRYRFQHSSIIEESGTITVTYVSNLGNSMFPVHGEVTHSNCRSNLLGGIFMEKEIIGPVDDPVDILKEMINA